MSFYSSKLIVGRRKEVCVRGAKKWVEEADKIGQEGLQTFIAGLVAFR